MNQLVSIIIPNYNNETYLKKCIESVIAQSYRPIEIVVVDDCSTDGSVALLKDLDATYEELTVIYLKNNNGVSAARNKGLVFASGEYVTMLDSDDYYYNKDKIANEMRLIRDGSNFAYSKVLRVDLEGNPTPLQFLNDKDYLEGDILIDCMIGNNMNNIPRDYIIPRNLAIKCGGYPEGVNLYEDLLFLVKLLSTVEANCTFAIGTAYRQNTNGLSSKPAVYKFRLRWNLCWNNRSIFVGRDKYIFMIKMLISRISFEFKTIIKRMIGR